MNRKLAFLLRTVVLCSIVTGLALGFNPGAKASPLALSSSGPLALSPSGVDARHAVAVSAGDALHVVWEQDGGIWHRMLRNGVWKPATQIVAQGEHPTLAAAPNGPIVYLAWSQSFGGNYEIFSSRWDGFAWSPGQNVSSNNGGSATPALAVGPSGNVHLFWSDTGPGVPAIYESVSAEGLVWPTATPLSGAKGMNPSAAYAHDGTLHLAWQYRASFSEKSRIWTSRYQGAWQTPSALTDGSNHALAPRLATGSGMTLLTWQEGTQSHLASWQSGSWATVRSATGEEPAVSLTDNGFAVWSIVDGSSLQVLADYGSSWWHPLSGGPQMHEGKEPAMAVHGSTVHLLWTQNDGQNWRIVYAPLTLEHLYAPIMLR